MKFFRTAIMYMMGWFAPAARDRLVRFDLDETLVRQERMSNEVIKTEKEGWRIYALRTEWCYYRVRPSALRAIETLRKHGCQIEIQTNKGTGAAVLFLKAAGIFELFDAVHGKDSEMTPPEVPWVLVDNLNHTDPGAASKVLQARGWDRFAREFHEPGDAAELLALHYVQCGAYEPKLEDESPSSKSEDPAPLTELIPEILRMLAAQD
jgi:hypothetical protein